MKLNMKPKLRSLIHLLNKPMSNDTQNNDEQEKVVAAEPNLDKMRDERVVPLVHDTLHDLAELLIPEDASKEVNFNPLILKILERTFGADLNITTEVSYLFQMILSVLTVLNTTVQKTTTVPIDDVRYGAIAKKVLAIVAGEQFRLGQDVKPEELQADFAPVQEKINALFAEEKLTMLEVKYIMDNIFSSFTAVHNGFQSSLEQSAARAEAKLFGVDNMNDLTMKKLNEILTAPVSQETK